MDELADSSGLAGDSGALRGRLAADGYLFFRGLLPAGQVRAAGEAVTERLRAGGWMTARGTPTGPPRATGAVEALADPAFRAAITSAAFNRLPYLPGLRAVIRRVAGDQAFSYPVKVLRAVYPERSGQRTPLGRYVHYDYAVAGVQDMLTTWLPLMDIPARLGGLAVQPGGHLRRLQRPRLLGRAERGWATTGYRPGDVVVFHSLTPHAALPNSDEVLRISGDFRWQRPDQPAPAELVFGPDGRRQELFSRRFGLQGWWEPVPGGLVFYPRRQMVSLPPGPSRFFAVHPSWRRWQPPAAAVH